MPTQDELILALRQIGADDIADGLTNVAKDLDKLEASQDKVNKVGDEAVKTTQKQVRGLADLKAGLDIVKEVGGKVVDFLKDAVEGTVKYAEEVRDLSRAIGANAEETSALIQVADDVKVSTGTLESAFKAAIKNGIRPSIDNLAKLSDEYRAIQDPVARSQFAMDKFGRAGLDMAKLLEQGGDAIRSAADEAKKLGLTLDESAVKQAREFEIQLDNLGDRAEALKLKIGRGLLPVVNQFLDTMDRGIATADLLSTGSTQLGDAFTATAIKMQADLAAGRMTLEDYNNGITGMAQSVKAWDLATGTALQNQFTLTEAMAQAGTGAYGFGGALDESARAAQRSAEATQAAARAQDEYDAAIQEHVNDVLAEEAAMKAYNLRQEEARKADEEAAKAQAAYRASVGETISKVDALAQSLAKATDAQAKQVIAQAQLDVLKKAFEEGKISQEQFNAATDKVLLNYDLATPKSLAMAKAQTEINTAFLEGRIPLDKYVESAGKIPQIAADGKVTLDEFKKVGVNVYAQIESSANKSSQTISNTADIAKGKVKSVNDEIRLIPEYRKATIEIDVTGDKIPSGVPGRAYGGPVSAGMPYIVGERGPEVIIPSSNGAVIPNTNNYSTTYNITTDRHGLAYLFERQRMAEMRM